MTDMMTEVEAPYSPFMEMKAQERNGSRGRRPKFTKQVSRARVQARAKRETLARYRANRVLEARHNDEFHALLDAERTFIARTEGPLPGDA